MVPAETIIETVDNDQDVTDQAQALVALANENGGLDNITVILVKFDKGDL
jgi:protein phosphatase